MVRRGGTTRPCVEGVVRDNDSSYFDHGSTMLGRLDSALKIDIRVGGCTQGQELFVIFRLINRFAYLCI